MRQTAARMTATETVQSLGNFAACAIAGLLWTSRLAGRSVCLRRQRSGLRQGCEYAAFARST
jgi:hypothetical protein